METNEAAPLHSNKLRVLVIDDEKNIRTTLSLCLEQMGCTVTAVSTPEAALAALRKQPYELCFLDLRLGGTDCLDVISKLLAIDASLLVIVITAYATIDTAVDAIKRGATDYLPKPFTPQQIRHVVDQTTKQRDLKMRLLDLEGRLQEAAPAVDLETDSPKIRGVFEVAAKASASDVPVLLRGKSGTGKSVLARMLHSLSPRKAQPLWWLTAPPCLKSFLPASFGHVKDRSPVPCATRRGGSRLQREAPFFSTRSGKSLRPCRQNFSGFLKTKSSSASARTKPGGLMSGR